MLDNLTTRLAKVVKTLRGQARLTEDIEYLYGRALQTNPGFVIQYVNDSDYSNDTVSGWAIKHVSNTLRYRLVITGSVDYVYIRYNSVTVVTKTAAGTFNETVDVTSLGLTVGDIYPLSVTIRGNWLISLAN